MENTMSSSIKMPLPHMVPVGEDRFGKPKILGVSSIAYKITSNESSDLFSAEVTLVQKGGPGRHVHYYQDEWWFIIEGEFILEIGDKQFYAKPGDSIFGPRKIPHVWAFVKGTRGRILGSVMPAGKVEAFFIEADLKGVDKVDAKNYDVEWVGPPLTIE